ncbi:hypothetical protein GCM10022198_00300 [Klugiella xanthotipulae]|uniref:hypothetical protein n=1 Tax=Klugiella xanthotipulae TaxID=244735 RepID=UPI00115070A7|nr:hypothetical protein [Klugiella xanthotipulae]
MRGNGGVRFAQTLRNNATKLGGITIETPNAYTEGERSVAEASHKFYLSIKAGKVRGVESEDVSTLVYDDREAPADTDIDDAESLIAGLRVAYGDSSNHPDGCVIHNPPCPPGWSPIGGIASDFWDTSNDPMTMRADFLNQTSPERTAFVSALEMELISKPDKVVSKTEPVTLGFDGSEGRKRGIADATVLVGYSVTQKHLFKIGCWSQPEGPTGVGWKPDKNEVNAALHQAFKDYNVVGFYADASAG